MKFYRVVADDYEYDEFNAFVVRAEDEVRALEIIKTHVSPYSKQKWEAHQLSVDGDEGVIVASFNAG